jgi:hypothetical protein
VIRLAEESSFAFFQQPVESSVCFPMGRGRFFFPVHAKFHTVLQASSNCFWKLPKKGRIWGFSSGNLGCRIGGFKSEALTLENGSGAARGVGNG